MRLSALAVLACLLMSPTAAASQIDPDPVDTVCRVNDPPECTTYYFLDADQDGYGEPSSGRQRPYPDPATTRGGDCDDTDPAVHPTAPESYDGRDEDCDGEVDEPVLVFSEVMADPDALPDTEGEWLEVANASEEPVRLDGVRVLSGNRSCDLRGLLSAKARITAARSDHPGFTPAVVCTLSLTNSGGRIALVTPIGVLDLVDHPVATRGTSWQLAPAAHDPRANDRDAAWCLSETYYGSGDRGTPNVANHAC